MNFTDFYNINEAKINALRQLSNLWTSEQKMDINLKKDLKDFHEMDENTFDSVTNILGRQYQSPSHEIYYRYKYRLLTKKGQESKELLKQRSISNVFKGVLHGDKTSIEPYDTIEDVAVFETMRRLFYKGYVVIIVTKYKGENKYFIGADRNGLFFFKQLTGTNLSTYVNLNSKPDRSGMRSSRYEPKEEKPETKEKEEKPKINKLGYIKITGSEEQKSELFNEIKTSWGTESKEIKVGKKIPVNKNFTNRISQIEISYIDLSKKLIGYTYTLIPSNTTLSVYKRGIDFIILFNNGEETINEVKRLKLFDNFKSITPSQIFNNIDYVGDIKKIKL